MAQVISSSLTSSNNAYSPSSLSDHNQNTLNSHVSSHNNQELDTPLEQQAQRKKKKATRACFHCQKAHLTCDDSRPCQRCIKRNLASSCKDGVRKKAKYLQDAYEESPEPVVNDNLTSNGIFNNYPMKQNHGFDSEALNLEYSMLSTMLTNPNPTGIPDPTTWATVSDIPTHNLLAISNMMQRSPTMINTVPAISAIYHNPTTPFNYTEGFHYLLRYIRERMDKDAIMRICKAMALFRPSFIILIKNLTEEDLIFMEKSFQRITLEFEKLISFSGTPTILWRRTGQIALVGKEFSLLTQWSKEDLLGKPTYIYELMDNDSAVNYWEKFATHAFDNSEQSVMTKCTLISSSGRSVPCTFCFTFKRDIFDIPLAIVGNFLPILG
ncbi:Transcriptional regulator of nonfermentable carbon utilization [Basidiobolus ranarum]|uniref:Transcriptional regulator of nonfermentable carbon utilization n=1 Tax=Basidiobolus ranarum TaxID=34480 RepID=A0ABR2WTF8_9FUNG